MITANILTSTACLTDVIIIDSCLTNLRIILCILQTPVVKETKISKILTNI